MSTKKPLKYTSGSASEVCSLVIIIITIINYHNCNHHNHHHNYVFVTGWLYTLTRAKSIYMQISSFDRVLGF